METKTYFLLIHGHTTNEKSVPNFSVQNVDNKSDKVPLFRFMSFSVFRQALLVNESDICYPWLKLSPYKIGI